MITKRFILALLLVLFAVPLIADEFKDLEDKIKDYMKSTKISSAEKANLIRQLKEFNEEHGGDAVELCFFIIDYPDKNTAKLEKEKEKLLKEVEELEKTINDILTRADATGRIAEGEVRTCNECIRQRNEILEKKLPEIEDKLRMSAVTKNAAVYVLQRLDGSEAHKALLEALEDKNWKKVFAALEAIKYQKWAGAFDGLELLYPLEDKPHKNAQVRAMTLSTMLAIVQDEGADEGNLKTAKKTFIVALKDESWMVRSAAVKGLGFIADEDCVGPLISALARETGRLKWEIVKILQNITGKKFADDVEAWKTWWKANKDTFEPVKKGEEAVKGRAEEGSHDTAEFYKIKLVSNAPIFVIDRSGSMVQPADTNYYKKILEDWLRKAKQDHREGKQVEPPPIEAKPPHKSRWEVLQMKLKKAVESLSEKDATFNIVWYSSDVDEFSEDMAKASKSNKKKAVKQIDKMKADGMTNIHDALKRAFEIAVGAEKGKGGGVLTNDNGDLFADTIFFLTDGYPTWGPVQDPRQIRKLVKEWNSNLDIKIHCIGIGIDPGDDMDWESTEFLQKLAEDNGGKCEFVNREPKDEEDDD